MRVVTDIPEHLADRSVAFSQRHIRALIFLPVLDVQTQDLMVMLLEPQGTVENPSSSTIIFGKPL